MANHELASVLESATPDVVLDWSRSRSVRSGI
jgi:hypothetical protein